MPLFIENPTLAPALLDHVRKHASDSDAALVATYLREGGDTWWPVENALVSMLALDESLDVQLRAHNERHSSDFQSAMTPVLMVWSPQGPTGSPPCTKMFPEWLLTVQGQLSSAGYRRVCQSTNAFMAMLIPLVPQVDSAVRDEFIESVSIDILDVGLRWSGAGLSYKTLVDFAVGITLLVHQKPEDPSQEHYYAHSSWRRNMPTYLNGTLSVFEALRDNHLPPEVILQAYRQDNTDVWVAYQELFMPYLSQDEQERFLALPNEDATDLEDWMEDGYIERKRRLVKAFCPTLYPLIDLLIHDKDWCSHSAITAVAMASSQKDIQGLPLPPDLNTPW